MSIDAMISGASQLQSDRVKEQVAMSIAKKAMDSMRQQGEMATQLIEAAAQISTGGTPARGIDLKA
jgi:hypothetical protein